MFHTLYLGLSAQPARYVDQFEPWLNGLTAVVGLTLGMTAKLAAVTIESEACAL
jgi:hypothetical protein